MKSWEAMEAGGPSFWPGPLYTPPHQLGTSCSAPTLRASRCL